MQLNSIAGENPHGHELLHLLVVFSLDVGNLTFLTRLQFRERDYPQVSAALCFQATLTRWDILAVWTGGRMIE